VGGSRRVAMLMFTTRRRAETPKDAAAAAPNVVSGRWEGSSAAGGRTAGAATAAQATDVFEGIARQASGLGREAAEVNGVLEDVAARALAQARTLDDAMQAITTMVDSNRRIGEASRAG